MKEPKLQLPSSVFPSGVEEDIGLLNRAAPHSGESSFPDVLRNANLFIGIIHSQDRGQIWILIL